MKKLILPFAALTLTAASGCLSYSEGTPAVTSGSVSEGGYGVTATIRSIGETGQYKTELTIDRAELDGSRTVMAAPWLVSNAGQPAVMTFESTCTPEDLRVEVVIPAPDSGETDATITVGVYDGEIVAAEPVLVLAVPR